ncbi:MAG: endonuclease domain-containing protein [Rudaea sp.]
MTTRLLEFAKGMRRGPTDAEAALWRKVRAGRLGGFKFKRQHSIGSYIVDFVCFERRLILEVDGGQHERSTDAKRTDWLEEQGFRVLRFWNNEVLTNMDGVLEAVLRVLSQSAPSPQPLSREGRGA